MTATVRRRRPGRRKEVKVPTWVLSCALVATLTGIGGFYAFNRPAVATDARMCRGEPTGLSQIVVDTSDPLSPRQMDAVQTIVRQAYGNLAPAALLEVGTMGEKWDGLWSPPLSVCRMALTAGESDSGATTRHLNRQYQASVAPKLAAMFASLANAKEAQASPIFEAVASAVASGSEQKTHGARHLIVVSDFLEATSDFPEAMNARLTPKSTSMPVFAGIKGDLTNIHVHLYEMYRRRAPRLQTVQHREFVKAWFSQRGAIVDDLNRIPSDE